MRDVVAAEARFLWEAMRRGFRAGFLLIGALALVWVTVVVLTDDAFAGERALSLFLGAGYALFLGVVAGLAFGITYTSWRAVGAWVVVPFVLVPATLWLSLALFDGFLAAQVGDLVATAEATAREHDWNAMAVGGPMHVGPVILVILLPLLLVDLGAIALAPAVLAELGVLVFDVALVLAIGAIPGALASAFILAIAYLRRLRRRHAT